MIEALGLMKATLTDETGQQTEYMPTAIVVQDGEQYVVMRAEHDRMTPAERVLLLHIDQNKDGNTLSVVEDLEPFEHLLTQTLGTLSPIQ